VAAPSAPIASLDLPVADIMRRWPETVGVFVARHMACPGCPMAPFMTLAEAARAYGMEPAALLEAVSACMDGAAPADRLRPAS